MRNVFTMVTLSMSIVCGISLVGCKQASIQNEAVSEVDTTDETVVVTSDESDIVETESASKSAPDDSHRITAIVEDDYKSLYEKSFTVRDEIMQYVAEVKAQANDDDNVSSIYETFDENNYYSDTGYEHYGDGFIDNCIEVFAADTVSFEELADIAAKNGMYIISYMADINVAQFRIDTEVFETVDDAKQKAADVIANSDGKIEEAFPSYLMDFSYD